MERSYNMNKEKKIYTEVYMTLVGLSSNLINKIPDNVKNMIISKADTSYPYRVDELLPESKAIIAAIIEKYIID